ncbi:MAG TPA: N-carbamoyl-D-amino-acid hydrolase [Gammaproteobacteria bacterium]|nr:N-carbamoyl-D-amino-acid hydrolase [Gammaproteobacteria bacterium]HIM06731.1 N-carbamoyl-D-amino-acid hydrolase [Gammaproteobacteria bacterium]
MTRSLPLAVAQLGPIARDETRASAVKRMIALLRKADDAGSKLIVFPELALTTFFPRWYFEDQADVDAFFETDMPNADTEPLFDAAARAGIAFYLGYAELISHNDTTRRFNTSILVDQAGEIVGKYRKIHLPGHRELEPDFPFQHLEKRYFETGDLGFPVFNTLNTTLGMCICNDRRWPETYRMLGLQGVEIVMLGYNTPVHYPRAPELDHLQDFHNHLSLQAGAYQNGTWVAAAAKAGCEENCNMIGGSCIVSPSGEIVTRCETLADELITWDCDLDLCQTIQNNIFNFALHREPENYGLIVQPQNRN